MPRTYKYHSYLALHFTVSASIACKYYGDMENIDTYPTQTLGLKIRGRKIEVPYPGRGTLRKGSSQE